MASAVVIRDDLESMDRPFYVMRIAQKSFLLGRLQQQVHDAAKSPS
jgi:hypothetical protein